MRNNTKSSYPKSSQRSYQRWKSKCSIFSSDDENI